ncbi:Uma2 family endonuclease [Euhalothece natronophila Z-M001]|uniref:Uma2 family endonuclease n=1 Tax=Euhalothece natronophila Z-M001 TaxID=522448 RepID=A0A5B8NJY5_9CHRO|nr:Uma2 family endonuclease [Euhalothece natronophila]QDZ39248.1 Uma2 family endonuclease [Euhalothece natronophila Z-M001]
MIASPDYTHLTSDQYLQLEASSPIKHEYRNGKAYAMAGTTDSHNLIAGNLYTMIRNHLRGSNFRVYFADVKARLESCNCFYYPDLMVTFEDRDAETTTYKSYPKLIVEILSDSTEAFDRGDKFIDYQTLPTLEEYVLISSKKQRVECYRRTEKELWLFQFYLPNHKSFYCNSIGLEATFSELYENVIL